MESGAGSHSPLRHTGEGTEQVAHTPSTYQAAVYKWIKEGTGDAILDSVPGSGKTTTLVEATNHLAPGTRALVCSFNKHIAVELGERMPTWVTSSTINALGWGILTKNIKGIRLNKLKYTSFRDGIVAGLTDKYWPGLGREERDELLKTAGELIHFMRLTLTGPKSARNIKVVSEAFNPDLKDNDGKKKLREGFLKDIQELAFEYDLNTAQVDRLARLVIDSLHTGILVALGEHPEYDYPQADFDDQIWLPIILGMSPEQFDWVMVDEAQDLSRCQLNLVAKARREGGRMLFVGDRRQAIYMFAGADCQSMDRIEAALKCTRLPLSICYRCPKSHIDLANTVYPGIEARPLAPEGELRFDIEENWALSGARITEDQRHLQDIFICRNNAPLVSVAYKLIRSGKPAKVRGKNIGEGLTALVGKVIKWSKNNGLGQWSQFDIALEGYTKEKVREAQASLSEDKKEAAIDALLDKVETLTVIKQTRNPQSAEDLKAECLRMFGDQGDNCIWLSSIHKSKGLEAKRVFILEPQLMPSRMAKNAQQLQQEHNIIFIAYTRAKSSLFVLRPRPKSEDTNLSV